MEQILTILTTNYLDVTNDLTVAARTGAWFWQSKGLNTSSDNDNFDRTTIVVHGSGANDLTERSNLWKDTVKPIVFDTNSFGNIRAVTGLLGINALNADGYKNKFGICQVPRVHKHV